MEMIPASTSEWMNNFIHHLIENDGPGIFAISTIYFDSLVTLFSMPYNPTFADMSAGRGGGERDARGAVQGPNYGYTSFSRTP